MLSPMRLLPLAAALLVLAGCAGSRLDRAQPEALPSAFPNHTAADALGLLQTPGVELVAARGDIALTTPDLNGSFGLRVVTERGGSTLASVRAFGFEGARVLVRPDSFFAINRLERTFEVGSLEEAAGALPFPVGPDGAFEALTGLVTPDPSLEWSIRPTGEQFYLLRSPDGRLAYTVDPSVWRVVRFVAYDETGALVGEQLFERFVDVDGVAMPSRITLRQPAERAEAVIAYSDLDRSGSERPPARLDTSGLRVD
jgi:hypothetical protein